MSLLYVSKFIDDNGSEQFGLFYDDLKGNRCIHEEYWKSVVFDSEKEAHNKLEQIIEERKREDDAVPFSLEEANAFSESHRWKFATTYAKTSPHEYLVKAWLSEDDKRKYERFVAAMKKNAVVGYFYGHKNDYFILGDHYYWFMGQHDNMAVDLINRTTINYLEYHDGAYYYKGVENNE